MPAIRFLATVLSRIAMRVIGGTFLAFVVLEASIPGGLRAVVLGAGADPTTPRSRAIIERYHLDGNYLTRYWSWFSDAIRGDFGRSIRGDDLVTDIIWHRLPISLELALAGTILAVMVGIPAGLFAALWAHRRAGSAIGAGLSIVQSIPMFISPVFLTWFFAVKLQWLPASGWTRISESLWGNLERLILPVTALALSEIAFVARTIRSDVLRVLDEDYIAGAFAKGLSRGYVIRRHAMRPASLGLLNVIGMNVGALLGGALVIEIIFGIGGLGQELFQASIGRDLPVILGITTYAVLVHGAVNTMVDAAVYAADPRIRR